MTPDASHVPTGPYLGGYRDALSIMAATPAALDAILAGIPGRLLDRRPVDDEWSAHEILDHMVIVEGLLFGRVKSMVATDAVPPHRADATNTAALDVPELLARWRAARQASLVYVHGLAPDDLLHGADLPRYGRVSVEQQVNEWAYHDLEHLRQLLVNTEEIGRAHV